jgi:hypothetical protein
MLLGRRSDGIDFVSALLQAPLPPRRILAPMHLSSRLPAYLLLGLVLVATALLIAGYGVPVGIGVLTGLLLGWAVFVGFLGLHQRSGGSRVVTWGTDERSPNQPDMGLIERHGHDSMRVAGVDAGALRRVIPLGDLTEAGGAQLELVAVEIREDGCIATLVARTRPPVGPVGSFVDVAVSDDAGTAYVASGQGSGGSYPGASRHEVRFAPAPPEGARTLTIRIEAFEDPFPGRAVQLRGPWEFRVAL